MPKRRQITEAAVGLSKEVAFAFDGVEYHLRYRPGAISPVQVDKVDEMMQRKPGDEDGNSNEVLAEFIYRCVRWWDLEEEDGTMTPLTRSSVRDIEPDYLLEAFSAIVNDVVPGEASAAPSSSTSS